MEVMFTKECSNFGHIRLQTGQKMVYDTSRISRNFSREMCRSICNTKLIFPKVLGYFLIFCTSHDFILSKTCPNYWNNDHKGIETDNFQNYILRIYFLGNLKKLMTNIFIDFSMKNLSIVACCTILESPKPIFSETGFRFGTTIIVLEK